MFARNHNGRLLPKLGLVLVLLAGLAVAGFYSLQGTARVVPVKRAEAVDAVTGSVMVHADGGIRELKSEAAGKVVWCEAIDPGSKFKEGDRLVQLDTTDLQRAIDKFQRNHDQELERARIRRESNSAVQVAKEALETAQRLNKIGTVAEEQVRAAERAFREVESSFKLSDYNEEQAKLEFEAQMKEFKLQLERMTIRAPMDGAVEGALTWRGALINAGQPVAHIFSNKRVVAVKISEENFGRVRIGQRARLRLLTYGEQSFDAKVSKLLPTADDAQRFTVYLDVEVDPEQLKPNSTGEATITVDRRENAQIIPRRALINSDEVLVVKDGVVEMRKVKAGFIALNVVEIREGLEDGELVIVENQEQFRPGRRVRVEVLE